MPGPGPFVTAPYAAAPTAWGPYGPSTGYPAPPAPAHRPGTVTGAAVLAFITGGLDLVGCLATIGIGVDATVVGATGRPSVWFALAVALVSGGLLIAGGVTMLRGRPPVLLAGGIGTAVVALYWLTAFWGGGVEIFARGIVGTYALIYLALAVVMVALAYSTSARQWCRIRAPHP